MSPHPKDCPYPKFGYELYPNEGYGELIPSYIGRWQCVLLSGVPFIGKTRFAFYMAEALANGSPFFWKVHLDPVKVMYLAERPIHSIKRTIDDLGLRFVNPENMIVYSTLELPPQQEAKFIQDPLKWLEDRLNEHRPEVVYLDTFGHFMPSSKKGNASTIDYNEMLHVMRAFNKIGLQYRTTPFLIHHNSKKEDYQNLLSRVSGSNSITGGTLTTIMMEGAGNPPELGQDVYRWPAVKLMIQYHHGSPEPIIMTCNEDGTFELATPKDLISDAVPPGPKQVERAFSVIPHGVEVPLRDLAKNIMAQLQVSRQRSYKLIAMLAEDKRIEYVVSPAEGKKVKLVLQ